MSEEIKNKALKSRKSVILNATIEFSHQNIIYTVWK